MKFYFLFYIHLFIIIIIIIDEYNGKTAICF